MISFLRKSLEGSITQVKSAEVDQVEKTRDRLRVLIIFLFPELTDKLPQINQVRTRYVTRSNFWFRKIKNFLNFPSISIVYFLKHTLPGFQILNQKASTIQNLLVSIIKSFLNRSFIVVIIVI